MNKVPATIRIENDEPIITISSNGGCLNELRSEADCERFAATWPELLAPVLFSLGWDEVTLVGMDADELASSLCHELRSASL